jgi:hypothetical protein
LPKIIKELWKKMKNKKEKIKYPKLFILGGLTKRDIFRKKCDRCKKNLVGLQDEKNVELAKKGVPVWCLRCVFEDYPFENEKQKKELERICQIEFD